MAKKFTTNQSTVSRDIWTNESAPVYQFNITTHLSLTIRKLHYLFNLGLGDLHVMVLQLGQEIFDVDSSFVK